MNTALLFFTLHLIEVEIDRQLDAPYVERCVELESFLVSPDELICMKEFLER